MQFISRYSTAANPGEPNTQAIRYVEQPLPFGRWMDIVAKFKHSTRAPDSSKAGSTASWSRTTQAISATTRRAGSTTRSSAITTGRAEHERDGEEGAAARADRRARPDREKYSHEQLRATLA